MKKYREQNIWRFGWAVLVGVTCLAGCQTADQADSGDMASVTISGHTDAEIQQVAGSAFLANGYQQVDPLTFEKQGTGWDKVNYGGWSSNPVWIRMKIHIASAEPRQSILACDAYAVVDHNEASMEEEKKLSVAYSSECKKILDQAKDRLDSLPNKGAQ